MKIVKGIIGAVIGAVALTVLIAEIDFLVFDITRKEDIFNLIVICTFLIGGVGGGLLLSKVKWLTILALLIAVLICLFVVRPPPK